MLGFEIEVPIWPIQSRNQVNSFDESLMVFAWISDTESTLNEHHATHNLKVILTLVIADYKYVDTL